MDEWSAYGLAKVHPCCDTIKTSGKLLCYKDCIFPIVNAHFRYLGKLIIYSYHINSTAAYTYGDYYRFVSWLIYIYSPSDPLSFLRRFSTTNLFFCSPLRYLRQVPKFWIHICLLLTIPAAQTPFRYYNFSIIHLMTLNVTRPFHSIPCP